MPHIVRVEAEWDPEAAVWVAESDDVPGLVAEAETVEALTEKLRVLIPELIALNNVDVVTDDHGVPFHLLAQRHERTRLPG